ncbi:hypothetical protein AB1Y20_017512 [Prymnesium parvum]|uniref:Ketosynthase family 3 (KS3) domain-containing protein n=1 Tax=Prymnesium parvum TaxID=97485 RepID=A0AB34JKG8_PRYPA
MVSAMSSEGAAEFETLWKRATELWDRKQVDEAEKLVQQAVELEGGRERALDMLRPEWYQVTIPEGYVEGERLELEIDGVKCECVVPPGMAAGETFGVPLPKGGLRKGTLQAYVVDESLDEPPPRDEAYEALYKEGLELICNGGDLGAVSNKALAAIERTPTRPEAYLLLGDAHAWAGNLAGAYDAYISCFDTSEMFSFCWAKAALMAYELVNQANVEGRPADVYKPKWMTVGPTLRLVADGVQQALGPRQPGIFRMKADAYELAADPIGSRSARLRARLELARRLRTLSGEGASLPWGFAAEARDERGERPADAFGSAVAMLCHSLGIDSHLCANATGPAEGKMMLPLQCYAPEAPLPVAILGCNARWPGGANNDLIRSRLMTASGDAFGPVPYQRWRLDEHVDSSKLPAAALACVQHGAFVSAAQCFDAAAFNISPAEANAMDPQQRLLLEHAYAALHGAAEDRTSLMGGDTGVFLGIERPDWALAQPPAGRASVYAVTGDNVSAAAGRVSFVLGLQGPCSTIDTACSSALVAMHTALGSVRNGQCADALTSSSAALTMAASLKLVPHPTLGAASAGMLSVDGRCKTLDARANGYARSEAVCALALRPVDDAKSAAAPPSPLLGGTEVRQDGKSASLTAPNGSAQRKLIRLCTERAGMYLSEVGWVEAHGTGTALGDPTEMGAVGAEHGKRNPSEPGRRAPMAIVAAKGNVGHSEAPSGHTGVLKTLSYMLPTLSLPGNCHLRTINPLIDERLRGQSSLGYALPTQNTQLAEMGTSFSMAGGVSSFGYSGTIAHCILRHCTHDEPNCGEKLALARIESIALKQWGWDDI